VFLTCRMSPMCLMHTRHMPYHRAVPPAQKYPFKFRFFNTIKK
jgi:hypothetical protein